MSTTSPSLTERILSRLVGEERAKEARDNLAEARALRAELDTATKAHAKARPALLARVQKTAAATSATRAVLRDAETEERTARWELTAADNGLELIRCRVEGKLRAIAPPNIAERLEWARDSWDRDRVTLRPSSRGSGEDVYGRALPPIYSTSASIRARLEGWGTVMERLRALQLEPLTEDEARVRMDAIVATLPAVVEEQVA